ncbi:MAG: hypothetical protein QOE70_6806 [Chthoniobacter sp.]|jgi:PAS domain S-box-containing protein|nr:hypothetical protein [Chthoniobacter sp.]
MKSERLPPPRYRRLPWLVVALIVCGAGMGWLALNLVKQRLIEAAGERLALAAADIADKLDLFLFERFDDVKALAGVVRGLHGDPEKLGAHLAAVRADYPVYQWFGVTDAAGRVVASTDRTALGGDWRETDWFAAVRDSAAVYVGDARAPEERGGARAVLFAAALRDEQGNFLGAVAAECGLPAMDILFQNTLRAFQSLRPSGTQLEWQILTRDGRVLHDSRQRGVGLDLAKGLPSVAAIARGESGWIEEAPPRGGLPAVTGFAPTRGRGEFPGLGWGVLVRLDRAAVLASVQRDLWSMGLAGAFVLVPLVVALIWAVQRLRQEWARVAASETHLATTLRSLSEGVITTDRTGHVTMMNSSAETLTGWRAGEARGRAFEEIARELDLQSRAPRTPATERLARDRQAAGVPERALLVAREGTERVIDQTSAPILDPDGTPSGVAIVCRDVTEVVEAETALLATAQRLENQNVALAAQARNPALRGEDLREAFRSITEAAVRTLGVGRASIWLYTEDRSAIHCADLYESAAERHSTGAELRAADCPNYFAALDAHRVIPAHEARTDPRTRDFAAGYLDPLGITSMLDASICSENRIVGVICNEHIGPARHWTLDEQSFAGSLADLAALSLEVSQRRRAEHALRDAHAELEKRVVERTAELSRTNAALQTEVAEHKRAEEALRESEARFRMLVESSPGHVWTASPEGAIDYVSQRLVDYTGCPAEEILGHGWQRLVHPDDLPGCRAAVAKSLATGEPYEVEHRFRNRDGVYLWHMARARPMRDALGALTRWFGVTIDITDRKRAEEGLRESEARTRLLVEMIPGLVWTAAPDGAVDWVSQRVIEYLGRPADEIIRDGWQTFVEPEDLPRTLEIWGHALATGEPCEIEYRLRGGDGLARWNLVRALPLHDPSGRIVKWYGANVDITDRKRLETAVAQARDVALESDRLKSEFLAMMSHELRTPLNSIIGFSGILRQGLAGPLNDEQKKQLGMVQTSARHLLALINDLLDLSRIESGKMNLHYMVEALFRGHGHDVESATNGMDALRMAERGNFDVIVSDILMPRMDGFQLCRELKKDERLRHVPLVIYTATYTDPRDAALALSLGADRFLLKPLEPEVFVMAINEVVAERRKAPPPKPVAPPEEDEAVFLKEYNSRLVEKLEKKMLDLEKANRALEADIAERIRLEEHLRHAHKMEAIGALAGGIAHDFNNILAGIVGFADLIDHEIGDAEAVRTNIRHILHAGERARQLVQKILTFSRQQEQERRPIKLQPVVQEALDLMRASLPTTIELQVRLEAAAPTVLADATQVHQVVTNLGTNAWHAIGDQPGRVEFELSPFEVDADLAHAHPDLRIGRYVRLTVRDSGCGMPPATLNRIFEPFFTTKDPGRGTGLGLAVVHGIMKSNDGAIMVYSDPGHGTTFNLFFPALELDPPALGEHDLPLVAGHGQPILFIDDEPVLATLGERYLTRLGYAPCTATDPVVALAQFAAGQFAAVVTDLTMPQMSGLELGRQIMQLRPGLPLILTTGFSASLDVEKARSLGFRDLLIKPYTMNALGQALHRALAT